MRPLIQAIACITPRDKPPQVTTQTLPCPVGQIGTGIHQERSVTGFDYGLPFTWTYGPWVTVNNDCADPVYPFVTNLEPFDPPMSGHEIAEGQEQLYAPAPVVASGYTMTLTYHVYVTGTEAAADLERTSDLTVILSPVPPAGSTLNIVWDRDYATFPDKAVDPSGTTTWLDVPNDEWTSNATTFTVTLTENV